MKRFSTALAALLLIATGCGQSGPLYIPGNPSRIEQPPPAAEAAEDEKKEENGSDNIDRNQ